MIRDPWPLVEVEGVGVEGERAISEIDPCFGADALAAHPDYRAARGADGRLDLGRKDPRFWPAAGVVLDVLAALGARVSEAAQ